MEKAEIRTWIMQKKAQDLSAEIYRAKTIIESM